jgi:diaminopropionate ammonia-lyase
MNSTTYSHRKHLENSNFDATAHTEFSSLLSQTDCEAAKHEISAWDGYQQTPLVELDDIAAAAGVKSIYYKDESGRFGLGSFKALGGSYAVFKLADEYKAEHGNLEGFAVATATDGNHGRSVAWGAQRIGVECHIFIHAHVSQQRADAMAALGAEVHRIDGNYDDSLVECETLSSKNNWQIVSDTSWDGYETVPIQVMAGYSVMANEIVEQLDGHIPSHFIIPAGCGGLAGGMLAYFWQVWKDQLPTIVIAESEYSDCVYQSLEANQIKLVNIVDETLMAGLSCGEVSKIIWPLLAKGVQHVVTIPDDGVVPMMQWLARPTSSRASVEGGECSGAGLIALMAANNDPSLKQALNINAQSTILVLGTEGATDPEFYKQAMES